jgi:hypothetical protein
VVLTLRRWRQVGEKCLAGDGDNKARSPGRARRKPLKPLRAGMPGESGEPRGDYARMLSIFCMRGCGCTEHPAFPTPSFCLGRIFVHDSGADAPRECGGVSLLASSPRTRGPITTGPGDLIELAEQSFSKPATGGMGPCFRRDDVEWWVKRMDCGIVGGSENCTPKYSVMRDCPSAVALAKPRPKGEKTAWTRTRQRRTS